MTTSLTTIRPAPPLRQSTIETLACPRSYKAIQIDGLKPPSSIASDRGDDVHLVAASYTMHCVEQKVRGDWEAFDRIALIAGAEAAIILNGVRQNYEVDWEHTTGAEVHFYLDENFQPCDEQDAWYSGTRDIDLEDADYAEVQDWKSHIRPFAQSDVPNSQSDMYALAKMQEKPNILRLKFRFRFVRYAKCERTADYTRDDIPRIISTMEAHRRRQLMIHARPDEAEAIPSKQCLYCPLLNNGCPIDPQVNPWAQGTAVEWTKRLVYLSYATEQAKAILKEHLSAGGVPIEYRDGKEDRYIFGPKATESMVFPLLPTMQQLINYQQLEEEHPSGKGGVPDVEWIGNLLVGATKLKSYLKAKKRSFLHQSMMDNAAVAVTKVKTGLHRADEDPEQHEGEDE